MNMTDYVKEAMRQLSNTIFYQVLSSNPTERFVNERDCILEDALTKKWITEKQFDFLRNHFPTTPVLYLLPKIHKSLINPPGRPIISSNESLLEPLSQFVDFHIRDIVKALPSYVADTSDVLRQLKDLTLPEQAFLVSFDVESLYTNIPH